MDKIIPTLTDEAIESSCVTAILRDGNFSVCTWDDREGGKTIYLNIRDILHLLKEVCEKDVAKAD